MIGRVRRRRRTGHAPAARAPAAGAVLEAVNLSVRVGSARLLDAVTLSVRRGELLAIVGPNGAGKSTLLAALAGDRPAPRARVDGDVLVMGRPVRGYPAGELARLRAVLPQVSQLRFPFVVEDVVRMGRVPWADPGGQDTAVAEALAAADVAHLARRRFTELSVGEQARVSLARVLAQDTAVILLDEPTAALDLRHTETVLATARRLADEGRAAAVVLHDLNLAAAHATTVAVLCAGTLRACGPPEQALTSERLTEVYGHPVTVVDHPLRPARLVLAGSAGAAPSPRRPGHTRPTSR